jgi:hypothetical protein
MARLIYTTELTVPTNDIRPIEQALAALSTAHDESGVRVEAGTFRWRGDELWVQLTLAVDTDTPLESQDYMAQVAVDTGLATDVQAARAKIEEVDV